MKMWAISILALCVGGVAGWVSGSVVTLMHVRTTGVQATLMAAYIAAGFALLATIVALWGVYSQRVLTRRQVTVQHLANMMADSTVQSYRKKFIELGRKGQTLAKWAEVENIGSEQTLSIISVLNDYELIAVGIKRGIYEYGLVETFDKSTIQKFWCAAHPFIVIIRERNQKPSLWKEFELLHDWVSGRKNPSVSLWWFGFG